MKYFAETVNYAKSYSNAFKGYMEEYYPNHILYYVPAIKSNR